MRLAAWAAFQRRNREDQTSANLRGRVRHGHLLIPSRVRRSQGRDSPDRGESSVTVPPVVISKRKRSYARRRVAPHQPGSPRGTSALMSTQERKVAKRKSADTTATANPDGLQVACFMRATWRLRPRDIAQVRRATTTPRMMG